MEIIDIIASLAAILSACGLIPQLIRTQRRKCAKDISWIMLGVFCSSTWLWMIYAIHLGSPYLIFNHAMSGLFELILCAQKWIFDKRG